MKNKTKVLITVYVLMAIFTFGHGANRAVPEHIPDKDGYRLNVAFFGSLVWPLYWSFELQRKKQ